MHQARHYDGAISGTGSLTKAGAGLLSLTGNNVVGGGSTVSGGVLAVNDSLTSNVSSRFPIGSYAFASVHGALARSRSTDLGRMATGFCPDALTSNSLLETCFDLVTAACAQLDPRSGSN